MSDLLVINDGSCFLLLKYIIFSQIQFQFKTSLAQLWLRQTISGFSHQEEGFTPGHSFPQHGAHVVTNSSQQDAKHGDAHEGVAHTEQLAVPRARRQVPKPCENTITQSLFTQLHAGWNTLRAVLVF